MAANPRYDEELEALTAGARRALPAGAAFCIERVDRARAGAHRAELAHVARAIPSRRREFAVGRACARSALAALGHGRVDILAGPMREPVWPEGLAGSITHHGGYCGAVAVQRSACASIGIDLGDAGALPAELAERICSSAEAAALRRAVADCDPLALAFCVKEAAYKCVFPLLRTVFDFLDIEVAAGSRAHTVEVHFLDERLRAQNAGLLEGRYSATPKHVFAAVWTAHGCG